MLNLFNRLLFLRHSLFLISISNCLFANLAIPTLMPEELPPITPIAIRASGIFSSNTAIKENNVATVQVIETHKITKAKLNITFPQGFLIDLNAIKTANHMTGK